MAQTPALRPTTALPSLVGSDSISLRKWGKSRLEGLRSTLIQWTRPSSDEQIFVILDELYGFARAFSVDFDAESTGKFYRQVLGGLAPDILRDAVRGTIARWPGWKYRRMPTPVDIAEHVPEAWQERRDVLGRVERELERREREAEEPSGNFYAELTTEQREAHDANMKKLKRILRTSTKRMLRAKRYPAPLTAEERETMKANLEQMAREAVG